MGKDLKGKELGKGLGVSVENAASRPCQKPKIGGKNSSIYAYTPKAEL